MKPLRATARCWARSRLCASDASRRPSAAPPNSFTTTSSGNRAQDQSQRETERLLGAGNRLAEGVRENTGRTVDLLKELRPGGAVFQ